MSARFLYRVLAWRRFWLYGPKRRRRRKPLKSIPESLDSQRDGISTVHVYDQLNRLVAVRPQDTKALGNETPAG